MSARQQQKRARQRTRAARQRERQRNRTRRQKARQEQRSRRAEGRQAIRKERVKQKGASGFYSPAGIQARGDVASGLVGQGIDIAGLAMSGGATGLLDGFGSRRAQSDGMLSEVGGFFTDSSSPASGGGGGGGGFAMVEEFEEPKPFYQNPLVIGGIVVGSFLIYRNMRK
jgi:hypothetical protein